MSSFYFGCEADDRTIAYAFSPANAHGFQLRPIFSSDIGHWDAGDIAGVVAEAFELVEDGILTDEQFAAFVYGTRPGCSSARTPGSSRARRSSHRCPASPPAEP